MLLVLEAIAQLVELRLGELLPVHREELGILPGRVWCVHASEALNVRDERATLLSGRGFSHFRSRHDRLGELASGCVLHPEHAGQVDQVSALLQLRKDELLLQFLVVALDEAMNDARRRADDAHGGRVVGREPARGLVVDEQDATKDTVLSHQILGRRDLATLLLLRSRGLRTARTG